jgi:hypothetical protein
MSRKLILSIFSLVGLLAIVLGMAPQRSSASSHREAPLISNDPAADNTDLYAFVSPDRPDTVTIIANYIPLEEPAGGPNFANFDPDVLYEIHIDNNGDAKEDITYQFRFQTRIQNKNTFLYNTGPITAIDSATFNYRQFYTVTRVDGSRSKKLGDNLPVPPANIGPRSIPAAPGYDAIAAQGVKTVDGGIKVFAGPRDDPFFVDLGSIFDLGGLRPYNGAHLIPLTAAPGVDGVGGYNVHTIAIQVPINQLTRNKRLPSNSDDPNAVIGIYASASRQKMRVLRKDGEVENQGPFVQVSRLGNPLINEVIIPLGDKDYWNASDPADDKQFQKYYEKPELAGLINLLYPSLPDARTTGRTDLTLILLTGVPLPGGHNLNNTGATKADLLRLNTGIAPTHQVGMGDPLGVLNGDLAGFPNGRRLEDDVTDIELRAVGDGYGTLLNTLFGLPNNTPNNQVGDGVNTNDMPFKPAFPYVATPHQGYEHMHHAVGSLNPAHLN